MRYTIFAGSYFGIPVRIHITFPLILAVFGAEAWTEGGPVEAVRAVVLILAVFVCVVLHEFGHSLQVRRYGIVVRDVVLLPIGGMARAERIPEQPRQEIIVAISGPLVNFALALILYAVMVVLDRPLNPEFDFLSSLFAINLVLGLFNLIPAYPMDGGRILRGVLATRVTYLRATRYATSVGQLIAQGFVVLGFVYHELIMLPVIAMFIFFGAMTEENMIRVRHILGGRTVRDFIDPLPPDFSTEAAERLPSVDAGVPATEAYYAMKSAKRRPAIVVESGVPIGVLKFDRLAETLRSDPCPDATR
jgi:Zn-dependent protease